MKKILIITPINPKEFNKSGGVIVSKRNIKILKNIFNEENIKIFEIKYYSFKAAALIYSIFGFCAGITPMVIRDIKKTLSSSAFDYIFLNTINFGILASLLQPFNVPVITFLHNVESVFFDLSIKKYSIIKRFLYYPMTHNILIAEKTAVKYSKSLITLNQRDSSVLKRKYNRSADFILPISFYDRYDAKAAARYDSIADIKQLLFVGVDFFGNTEGIFWFVENCLDKIDAELMVVGSGMDRYAMKYNQKRVKFIGYVEDIAACYYQADAVVLPILSGSGMKTKTCEALMYGKTIFGSKEAFEGYDALDVYKAHYLCNTAEDFIININDYLEHESSKLNDYSRKVYLNNYSSGLLEEKLYSFMVDEYN